MPDTLRHRGKHPDDPGLFAASRLPDLNEAVRDLSHLLSRGYNVRSAAKLVGDRYQLAVRQIKAVERCACDDDSKKRREATQIRLNDLGGRGASLAIDGYNVLISVECALSNGFLFKGRDGALRDIASVHGTYRRVDETLPALLLIATLLAAHKITETVWYLDAPVSNSGRLKAFILETATTARQAWSVEIVQNPDPILAASTFPVASSDSWILDRCAHWIDLPAELIKDGCIPHAECIDLGL